MQTFVGASCKILNPFTVGNWKKSLQIWLKDSLAVTGDGVRGVPNNMAVRLMVRY